MMKSKPPEKKSTEVKAKTPKPRKPKAKKPKKPHYVNSKVLLQQIIDYYEQPESVDMDPVLAENVYKIAKGLSFAPNFINYSYKDDMIGDAIVKMFTALQGKKFDPTSGYNPFSYFTTIAFHAFINRIKKEKKYKQAVTDYQEMVYDQLMETDADTTENKINYTNPYSSEAEE
jgi:hypothetical protein